MAEYKVESVRACNTGLGAGGAKRPGGKEKTKLSTLVCARGLLYRCSVQVQHSVGSIGG